MALQHSPFLATTTGLMGWKHSSDSYIIEGGWVAGSCLRSAPCLTVAVQMLLQWYNVRLVQSFQ